jgi:hypothetical protein
MRSDGVRTVRVRIYGRVHGVGYRAWTEETAIDLAVMGWVRRGRDPGRGRGLAGRLRGAGDGMSSGRQPGVGARVEARGCPSPRAASSKPCM